MKPSLDGGQRLVAYYRYSGGGGQTEQSIEGQRRDCEAWAKSHGLIISHEYIDRHISEKITLEELAERMSYSSSYISRIFKRYTGETLVQYITQKRVLHAKQLMARGLPLGQVADMAGFPTYSHFYKCFSRLEGVSPAEFRKKI